MHSEAPGARVTLREVFAANRRRKDYGLLLRAARPFGACLAWAALRLGVRPLAVSYTNFVLSFLICLLFAASSSGRFAAALLLVLWQVLDTTDGSMARAIQLRSNYGGFIDQAAGIVLLAFLHVSIGVGLTLHPDHSLARSISWLGVQETGGSLSLILGAYSSAAGLLARLLARTAEQRFRQKFDRDSERERSGPRWREIAVKIAYEVEGLGALQIPILVIAVWANATEVFLAFYTLVNVALLAAYTAKLFWSLRRCHEYPGA